MYVLHQQFAQNPEKTHIFLLSFCFILFFQVSYEVNSMGFYNTPMCISHPKGLFGAADKFRSECFVSPHIQYTNFVKNDTKRHWHWHCLFFLLFFYCIAFSENCESKYTIYFEWHHKRLQICYNISWKILQGTIYSIELTTGWTVCLFSATCLIVHSTFTEKSYFLSLTCSH